VRTPGIRAAFALAAALAAAGSADAVTLARNGIGQALIYPFYTVDNAQDTLISVVNPTAVGKVVEVRFLEGHNGVDVLDLVLFLSPHDVWTASISQISDDGGAMLRTSDTSCTLPPIPAAGENFSSALYDGSAGLPNDGGPYDITRLREGSIDMIAGGDIVPGSRTDNATIHPADFIGRTGVPDCASLDPLRFRDDLVAPTGGVFGSGSVVNVGLGTYFPYNGTRWRISPSFHSSAHTRADWLRWKTRTRATDLASQTPRSSTKTAGRFRFATTMRSTRSAPSSWPTRSTTNISSPPASARAPTGW